jgi:hypothetical protein
MIFIFIKVYIILFYPSGNLVYFLENYINIPAHILMSLFYVTVHNINYSYFHINKCHELHHDNTNTNFGPSICDIIFNTNNNNNNYNYNDNNNDNNSKNKNKLYLNIENTDHYIPNIIILTVLIIIINILMKYYFNDKIIFYKIFYYVFIFIIILLIFSTLYIYKIDYDEITTNLSTINNKYI